MVDRLGSGAGVCQTEHIGDNTIHRNEIDFGSGERGNAQVRLLSGLACANPHDRVDQVEQASLRTIGGVGGAWPDNDRRPKNRQRQTKTLTLGEQRPLGFCLAGLIPVAEFPMRRHKRFFNHTTPATADVGRRDIDKALDPELDCECQRMERAFDIDALCCFAMMIVITKVRGEVPEDVYARGTQVLDAFGLDSGKWLGDVAGYRGPCGREGRSDVPLASSAASSAAAIRMAALRPSLARASAKTCRFGTQPFPNKVAAQKACGASYNDVAGGNVQHARATSTELSPPKANEFESSVVWSIGIAAPSGKGKAHSASGPR